MLSFAMVTYRTYEQLTPFYDNVSAKPIIIIMKCVAIIYCILQYRQLFLERAQYHTCELPTRLPTVAECTRTRLEVVCDVETSPSIPTWIGGALGTQGTW